MPGFHDLNDDIIADMNLFTIFSADHEHRIPFHKTDDFLSACRIEMRLRVEVKAVSKIFGKLRLNSAVETARLIGSEKGRLI